jgi:hypothetical protein
MSTMRVTTLKNEASTVDQIVLNADGSFGGELASELGSKLNIAGGKILQIVRATDTTQRTTTSTSFTDVTGMAVTITPQTNTSAIIVIAQFYAQTRATTGTNFSRFQLTDSSNNSMSGANVLDLGWSNVTYTNPGDLVSPLQLIGYATPATVTAVTYKLRFRADTANVTARVENAINTGQMYAIEVSA